MKKIIALALIPLVGCQIAVCRGQQTYSQEVPAQVNEVVLQGHTRLVVKSTDGEMTLRTSGQQQVATVKKERLTIASSTHEVTLLLPAGRPMTFEAEDYASLVVDGSLGKRPSLTVHTKDYARALFSGGLADSVWAVTISLQAEDYSQIHSEVRLMQYGFEVLPKDFSHITVDCFQERQEPGVGSRTQKVRQCDNCFVDWNYCYEDSVINVRGDGSEAQEVHDRMQRYRVTHDGRPSASEELIQTNGGGEKRRSLWRWRDVALNFSWGFHNWGSTMWSGFEGADGDASIRTSFNHIHLSVDYPLVGTRHMGLYVGFGLEWDKYKFDGKEVSLNSAAEPHVFADGGDQACSTWLNTRYVVVPLTLRFDLWHDWNLSLSALPGLHWGGSHTGLRREYDTDLELRRENDQSINRHINPYKLDLRATLGYEAISLFLQVPTMSTFRSSVQELYPIKFGLSLWLD